MDFIFIVHFIKLLSNWVPSKCMNFHPQRVLTAEYIHGYKVSDVDGIKNAGLDIKDVDRKLVNAFAEQIFHTGFVHADPHPGNSGYLEFLCFHFHTQ